MNGTKGQEVEKVKIKETARRQATMTRSKEQQQEDWKEIKIDDEIRSSLHIRGVPSY